MKKFISISGGKSSAYIAANYSSDYLVFALVTSNDPLVMYPDSKLRQMVSDRIGREFIGTLEDDTIIHTMFDLEQYLGRKIDWVVGEPFEKIIENAGGYLPNKVARFCTSEMKMRPLFRWWRDNIQEPAEVLIGYRSGEERRAARMLDKCNDEGILEFKDVVGQREDGKKRWVTLPWQIPKFPMIEDGIKRDIVHEFWRNKPVRFADRNNCVGCFHRNSILLRLMFEQHPNKMEWFARQEEQEGRGKWQSEQTYRQIQKHKTQLTLMDLDGFSDCDSGYCGL